MQCVRVLQRKGCEIRRTFLFRLAQFITQNKTLFLSLSLSLWRGEGINHQGEEKRNLLS